MQIISFQGYGKQQLKAQKPANPNTATVKPQVKPNLQSHTHQPTNGDSFRGKPSK